MSSDHPIFVTQPYLPPLEEFTLLLQEIWQNKILTNGGPFHQQLERALCDYLGVEHLSLFTNGTLALVTALQALRRYFYPLISYFPMYRSMVSADPINLPVENDAASKVLCLPIYPGLSRVEQMKILEVITGVDKC